MKTFIASAIAALAIAYDSEKLEAIKSTSVSNEGSFTYKGQAESDPSTTLSYKTVGIVEKLKPD